jgi:hypothetical protein
MKLAALALLLVSAPAIADTVTADPNDPGKVTYIDRGVKELNLGGIFVYSVDKVEDTTTSRFSTLGGPGFQYFFNPNVSVGATALLSYDKIGDASAITFGGVVQSAFHVRLGLGLFFRPSLGVGALFGTREIDSGTGTITELNQTAFLVRIGLPLAYFASKRFFLQAGPEINISIGSFKADGADDGISFTTVSGGLAVGVGYVF